MVGVVLVVFTANQTLKVNKGLDHFVGVGIESFTYPDCLDCFMERF